MNPFPALAKDLNQKFNVNHERTKREILYKQVIKVQEEVGELAEAVLGENGDLFDKNKVYGDVAKEIADVMMVLYIIADLKGINIQETIAKKDTELRKRFEL